MARFHQQFFSNQNGIGIWIRFTVHTCSIYVVLPRIPGVEFLLYEFDIRTGDVHSFPSNPFTADEMIDIGALIFKGMLNVPLDLARAL